MKTHYQNPNTKNPNQKKKFYSKKQKRNQNYNNNCQQTQASSLTYIQDIHENDLKCFQHCSKWTLNLSTISNTSKSTITSENLIGKINQVHQNFKKPQGMNIPDNITSFLPIDIRANQRFALQPNQPKIPLNLEFDFKKDDTFANVNKDYPSYIFEINLNAHLHNKNYTNSFQVFKDSINFRVKGYDILKAIQSRMNSLNTKEKIAYIQNDKNGVSSYNTAVFMNIQCSFGVTFQISNSNLLKYFNANYHNTYYIPSYDIVITKLRIVYSLPLIVFTVRELKGYAPPVFHYNFCNWHSLMSCTTPVIYETENLSVKEILEAFIKPSLFGVGCLFRYDTQHYTRVNFFPSLNSLQININDSNTSSVANTAGNNDNSTLDGSFVTSISSVPEEKNLLSFINKQIKYKEQVNEIYNMKSYTQQYKNLLKMNPEIEDLTLNDINSDSYFSIIWSPVKTPQPKPYTNSNCNMKFFESEIFSSFEVFYQFRSEKIKNTGHYLKVIGINEKNIKGKNVDSFTLPMFDYFWFINKAGNANHFCFEQDLFMNKKMFYSYKNFASNLEL